MDYCSKSTPTTFRLHWKTIASILVMSFALIGSVEAQVVINEVNYDPEDKTELIEFVELYNAGVSAVDLSGWYFSDGISFTFPDGTTLDPDGYVVVGEDVNAVYNRFGVTCYGPFEGRLSNEEDTVVLRNADGETIDSVDYRLGFPWPTSTEGSSIELINPSLDNSLGGSWRRSGYDLEPEPPQPARDLISVQSTQWHYRKGTSEASSPVSAWREVDFVEDETWSVGQTSIGYGDGDDNTVLSDMQYSFSTVYLRHTLQITDSSEIPDALKLSAYVDDGCIVWLNGTEIARISVSGGEKAYNDFAYNHEATWESVDLPNPSTLLAVGTNVLAVHVLNTNLGSSDLSIDIRLFDPGTTEPGPSTPPTPGERNSVLAENAPPQIRSVAHDPEQPTSGSPVVITAKVTDPDGTASVYLKYQVVVPGNYIPAYLPIPINDLLADPYQPLPVNPAFEDPANWLSMEMLDDGNGNDATASDGVYTAAVPGYTNRTLVRYRIVATDQNADPATVTVPYDDDPSMNFAFYVYDGVPPYVPGTRSVHPEGPGHVYSSETLTSVPVYTFITRSQDISECHAYDWSQQLPHGHQSRYVENWEGTFVYDGIVYDHVRYRTRGAYSRYTGYGKRNLRIGFNRGMHLRARDRYGNYYSQPWQELNISKTFNNHMVGDYGILETMNSLLYNLAGVPTWNTHWFHLRVVDGVDEAPTGENGQYYGDFWGLFLAIENYDTQFLQARGMPDGNIYKLTSGVGDPYELRRNQGRSSVNNCSDYYNFMSQLNSGRTESELHQLVNYDEFYRFYAITNCIRHYDIWLWMGRNMTWFFEPMEGNPYGRVLYLPWDTDCTWGPSWNYGQVEAWEAIGHDDGTAWTENPGGKTVMKQNFRNNLREVRDLLWRPAVVNPMLDEFAAMIADFVPADRDRWRDAPADAGNQDFGTLEDKIADMKVFAWTGGRSWPNNIGELSYVGAGGWTAVVDRIAGDEGDSTNIPNTPTITYTGPPDYPGDSLTFRSGSFSDPQGNSSFAAMRWRIAEVSNVEAPGYNPAEKKYEITALWESDEIAPFQAVITIPPSGIEVGRTYRVRVRMKDNTGRWSHWSAPVEFVAGPPINTSSLLEQLRVTELMYNPRGGDAYEFIELHNISSDLSLDLAGAAFTSGISYSFPPGTSIPPNGYLLVVGADSLDSFAAFRSYYGLSEDVSIVGPYSLNFSNGGERVTIDTAIGGGTVISFEYDDDRGWPLAADGGDHSLVPVDSAVPLEPEESLDYGGNWRSSTYIKGSPGQADPAPPETVVLNEVMADTEYADPGHPEYDSNDWIEIYNPTGSPVVFGSDWYLSDDLDNLKKWSIPPSATVQSLDRVVFDEVNDFHNPISTGFGLDRMGESLFLSYLPGTSQDRIVDCISFKGQEAGVSLGRYPDGNGYWCHTSPSRDSINTSRLPDVTISDFMYHPPENPGGNIAQEYVRLYNQSDSPIDLWNPAAPNGEWRLTGGIEFTFPPNTTISADGYMLIVSFDPNDPIALAEFRRTYEVDPSDVRIVGPYLGGLSNKGERLAVERPQPSDDPEDPDAVSWVVVDEAIYFDRTPWPSSADGTGLCLERISGAASGNDPDNWAARTPPGGYSTGVPTQMWRFY